MHLNKKKAHRDCLVLIILGIALFVADSVHGAIEQSQPVQSSIERSNGIKSSEFRSLPDVLDQCNGAEFVKLFDPLMDRRISVIMDRVRHMYPDNVWRKLLRLPARNFFQILDDLSGGRLSVLIYAYDFNSNRARRVPLDTMSGMSLGESKRSSGLDPMAGLSFGTPTKRNFDEMDRSGFSGFAKRFSDFDEIDRAGFSGFAKRQIGDFDEMDRSGFSGFAKRLSDFDEIDRAGFSGFAKRFNFDEFDRNGFTGFSKRNPFHQNNPLLSMIRTNSLKSNINTSSGMLPKKNLDRSLSTVNVETIKNQ